MVPDQAQVSSLIRYVTEHSAGADPLDRLESACVTARELDDSADQLVNHFVTAAREAGLSWTQIGARMGVTKQAARKRFLPRDIPLEPAAAKERAFGRYTESARRAVALAQRTAQEHHHHYIGTEHLLLGLCAQQTGTAGQILTSAGVDLAGLTTAVTNRLLPPSGEVPDRLPFTATSKSVLELAAHDAQRLGHRWIGTEHLLMGLVGEQAGIASEVLLELGITMDVAEREALRLGETGPER
jgi:hypothetical protein